LRSAARFINPHRKVIEEVAVYEPELIVLSCPPGSVRPAADETLVYRCRSVRGLEFCFYPPRVGTTSAPIRAVISARNLRAGSSGHDVAAAKVDAGGGEGAVRLLIGLDGAFTIYDCTD
jgi:hypothetical protein